MSNKEINLQALLSLDERIQRELGAMEANINQLPQAEISRDLYSDYMTRFNQIRALFDRVSDILRDATLEQTNPDLYEILLTKERISNNYNVFGRMLGRFTRQYSKETERDEGRGERAFAPSAAPEEEDAPVPEEPAEDEPDGPSDEEIEAAMAEEEAAEAEAAAKKKKAAKKAHQEKVAQEERDAIEQDRAHREAERRSMEDQRRTEDRRLEDDRLAQDRARDAMLASELHKTPYEDLAYPERFYPESPAYEPPAYERADRGFERYPEERRYERPAEYKHPAGQDRHIADKYPSYPEQERHSASAPEYGRPSENEPPRYAEHERFYPSRHEDARYETQYPGREGYPEPPRFEDRHYEPSRHDEPAHTAPSYPEYEDRRQPPQSAADKRDQELRDADQRAREAERREAMHRERDERFDRFRARQQGGFTREEQQFGHFDYSVREGETGHREHGHSDYKSYDFREDPTYTAHEYAPGGTTQRPMTIGSTPRYDPQRFYSAPTPGSKTVTPEYLEQHRYEVESARLAYEHARGTPDAKAAETHYQQLRHSFEDTCKQIHSGNLEVAPPSPVSHADFRAKTYEDHRQHNAPYTSTQYNYLPGGGIAGAGISAAAPNGSVSYYNAHRDTPPVPSSRYESSYPQQSGPTSRGADRPRTSPVSDEPRQYQHGPVRTSPQQYRHEPVRSSPQQYAAEHKPYQPHRSEAASKHGPQASSEQQTNSYRSAPRGTTDTVRQERPIHYSPAASNHPPLPHSFRPLPNAVSTSTGAGRQPSRPDPVAQIKKAVAYRNVLRESPMPSPIPTGPRHFHINTAKTNPEVSQVSQIPGYFRKQQDVSPLGSRRPYVLNSVGGFGPGKSGSLGGSGQSKDGSSNGNGPNKSKVEETSSDLFNRKSRIRTESIAKHYSRIIAGKAEGYAAGALMMASRRFYQIAQSGEDNALRTLEQGRYYGTVAAGLASAYMHRKPVSSKYAIKSAGRREFREYGRFATMDKKQLTRKIHESLKSNRELKNEIRELMAKGSNLTVAERAELLKKRAQLAAASMEPRKMHGYRNMQAAHARDIRANKQIEAASEGGRITTKTVQKAMREDFKSREASMAKKFGALNRATDRSLRLEIQQRTQLGRALKNDIKQLKALQASGVKLTPAQLKKLQELLAKREANNKYLRQLHGLKKARLESNLSQKALQKKMTRLAKNKAAIRGGLYALYGIITKPIREGSEIGAQGLLKFANIATNHYVHEFIKRSLRAAKKTYLWGAKITGFNKTKFYQKTASKAKKVSSAMKGAPKKVAKATGKVVKKGAINTYQRVAPVKVKTAVASAYNRYTGAKGTLVAFKAKTQEWFANTWVGRTYSSISRFFGKIGRGISSALNVVKAVLAKAALIMLILVLLFQLITMIAGSGGSVSGSIILSPYEGPDGKLNLEPYNNILNDEWDAYMDELQQIGVKGGYYKVVIDMDVNPDNVKEILSMMAVRCGQELDILTNLQVKPYIKDLLRASHPYWTEKTTITCDDIDTCTNKKSCSRDGEDCFASSKLCSHGHSVRHRDYYWDTVKDPDTGKETEEKVWYTYYTWECDGHCGGHPQITFHVRTLSFDEIFEVDPHGAPTSSTATASTGALRGKYTITYYCNEKYPHTCNAGPPYKTATGTEPTPGRTIAVDPKDIALGAHVVIDGHEYVAEDTGGAVDGKHIDILVDTHAEALQKGTRYNVPVYKIKYDGESMEESGEWSGWTDDNRDWVKAIYEQDWTELYCGIPNVTDEVGGETDLSGVKFVDGDRPGHQSIINTALRQEGQVGGRPYWTWYGFDNRVEWCAIFVSWCANQDHVLNSSIPRFSVCSDGARWFVERGQWAKRGDTIPVAGDVIFFSWNADTTINHVGLVVGSDDTYVYTIEGNSRDKCRTRRYPLNDPVIYGYGLPNY